MNKQIIHIIASILHPLTIYTGVLFFIIVSCFDPVKLDHPDDPYSKNYILGEGSGCSESAHLRLDAHTAELSWRWNDSTYSLLLEHGDYVLLNRYVKHSVETQDYVWDTTFNIAPEDIIPVTDSKCKPAENEIVIFWTDSTLTLENDYRYSVQVGNSAGLAKDSVVFYYSHEFYTPDSFRTIQEYSDTSIICSWKNPGWLHNKMKISWMDSTGQVLDMKIIPTGNSVNLMNPGVMLDRMTVVDFRYGLNSSGSIIWQRKGFQDTVVMRFESVNDVFAVHYQKNLNRITWRYDSTKVNPDAFIITTSTTDSIRIPNNIQSTIQIDGKRYFVYFDESGSNNQYRIIPETQYHFGQPIEKTCVLLSADEIDGYTFVDKSNGQGFYISLYEMKIAEFISAYNLIFSDTLEYAANANTRHLKQYISTANNQLSLVNPEYGNLPIEWISWDLADAISQGIGHQLPTDEEWVLAARAGSGDHRRYPWGDSSPDITRCNFLFAFDSAAVRVDTLVNGSVDIYEIQGIKGPYNMSGNVKEWTQNSVILRNTVDAHHARGGSWWDDNQSHLLISDTNCVYTPSDYVGGIRLKK